MSKNFDWICVRAPSLALAVRNAGSEISDYYNCTQSQQDSIKNLSIRKVWQGISEDFRRQTRDQLYKIKQGVYVISVAWPFTITYTNNDSPVIYIGSGDLVSRFSDHLHRKLFGLMLSLAGADFDFHMSDAAGDGENNFHQHAEHILLRTFEERFGSLPLLNTNHVNSRMSEGLGGGWDAPFEEDVKPRLWRLQRV